MSKLFYQRGSLIAGVTLLVLVVAWCGYRARGLSVERKAIKQDYSIVNNVSFGLLSVNKWRDLLVDAVRQRIEKFSLTAAERDSLHTEIENILNGLINKADSMINAPQKTVKGKLRKFAFRTFVNTRSLHRQVPAFASQIMDEALRRRNMHRLAYVAKSKLEQMGEDTYDSSRAADEIRLDSIYRKYGVPDMENFNRKTLPALQRLEPQQYAYAFAMIGGVLLLLVLWYFLRNARQLYVSLYILSIGMALVLLLVGLTTTMIEIDLRIKSLNFELLGETISFQNQVIYFQSKSIVDVVALLLRTGKFDSILVGALILCFSIFFPITKLLSTGVYLLGKRTWSKSKFVYFFAFKSGKWSMADVMVVAILMAYIGFNGIIENSLSSLDYRSSSFSSITSSNTSLQPGYIIFVAFVLFGLVLSQILQWITREPRRKNRGIPAKQLAP
ncbi:MAG TPA: paraquat-inducible protein A [Puia sp.]|nr:paraquat-inducible protein A [Puia sp.]